MRPGSNPAQCSKPGSLIVDDLDEFARRHVLQCSVLLIFFIFFLPNAIISFLVGLKTYGASDLSSNLGGDESFSGE